MYLVASCSTLQLLKVTQHEKYPLNLNQLHSAWNSLLRTAHAKIQIHILYSKYN